LKREAALERSRERLYAERDRAVRAAYRGGVTMATIARVMEISHQRVSQIVRS
jgi:DNA-directed RNA polymerase specialized sigma subunit